MKNQKFFIIPIFTISIFLIFYSACSSFGKISVINDSFKGVNIVTLKMQHETEEAYGTFNVFNTKNKAEFTYIKEVKSGDNQNFKIDFSIMGPDINENASLDEKGFVKVGDKQVEFSVAGARVVSQTIVKNETATTPDYSKPADSTGHHQTNTTTTTSSATIFRVVGSAQIDPALLADITNSSQFAVRVYVKSQPYTFIIKEDDLVKIQEFAKTMQ